MNIRTWMISSCAAIVACANAAAATGDFNIDAVSQGSWGRVVGYCDGNRCSTPFGAVDNEFLSDGKKLAGIYEVGLLHGLVLAVSGFTSDPGKAYFGHIIVSCADPVTTYSSVSANYQFDAASGTASWGWSLGSDFYHRCMPRPGRYQLSIRD